MHTDSRGTSGSLIRQILSPPSHKYCPLSPIHKYTFLYFWDEKKSFHSNSKLPLLTISKQLILYKSFRSTAPSLFWYLVLDLLPPNSIFPIKIYGRVHVCGHNVYLAQTHVLSLWAAPAARLASKHSLFHLLVSAVVLSSVVLWAPIVHLSCCNVSFVSGWQCPQCLAGCLVNTVHNCLVNTIVRDCLAAQCIVGGWQLSCSVLWVAVSLLFAGLGAIHVLDTLYTATLCTTTLYTTTLYTSTLYAATLCTATLCTTTLYIAIHVLDTHFIL